MATKTFKIGEYCKGGIIQVKTQGNNIAVIGKDWDYDKGTRRGSDQTNAREWTRLEVNAESEDAQREISNFLYDLTTSYHTDMVMDWIDSKVKFSTRAFW